MSGRCRCFWRPAVLLDQRGAKVRFTSSPRPLLCGAVAGVSIHLCRWRTLKTRDLVAPQTGRRGVR
eukprot:scaffold1299_cov246-Pinguiococcus_pyrenoidosus.AAC.6